MCKTGEIFNVFETGKISIQGKPTELSRSIDTKYKGAEAPALTEKTFHTGSEPPLPRLPQGERPVFVVYGHDLTSRDQLELLLRRMGLTPIILGHLTAAGDTVIEKLEKYLGEHGDIGFACVLLTPDDEGHKAGRDEEKKYRARQNVVLELGMVLARLGRKRVAILHKESVELPSDIHGLLYISFKERIDELKSRLYTELKEAGYNPASNALN